MPAAWAGKPVRSKTARGARHLPGWTRQLLRNCCEKISVSLTASKLLMLAPQSNAGAVHVTSHIPPWESIRAGSAGGGGGNTISTTTCLVFRARCSSVAISQYCNIATALARSGAKITSYVSTRVRTRVHTTSAVSVGDLPRRFSRATGLVPMVHTIMVPTSRTRDEKLSAPAGLRFDTNTLQ